jgi:uncharacterized sulfatase
VAPEKYFWPYSIDTIELPDPGDRADVTELAFTVHPANYGEPEEMKKMKMCYLASVSFLDAQVGRLLRSLEEHGLMDNTIVVFFSDHGFHLGEHGQWHKFTLYEQSARVPLIMRVPGMTSPGTVIHHTVELVDLYPTLQQLCGLPFPGQSLSGRSLVPLLQDPSTTWEARPVFTQIRRGREKQLPVMGYSVRTEHFRYNEWWSESEPAELLATELYDLQQDAGEEFNQSGVSQFESSEQELRLLLEEHRATTKATAKLRDRLDNAGS